MCLPHILPRPRIIKLALELSWLCLRPESSGNPVGNWHGKLFYHEASWNLEKKRPITALKGSPTEIQNPLVDPFAVSVHTILGWA